MGNWTIIGASINGRGSRPGGRLIVVLSQFIAYTKPLAWSFSAQNVSRAIANCSRA
jgi:hypothetical protein